jgi:hypothetical protein
MVKVAGWTASEAIEQAQKCKIDTDGWGTTKKSVAEAIKRLG